MTKSYTARCSCGAIELALTGEPNVQIYCHCTKCRKWSAAPVTSCALWPTDAVKIVQGAAHLVHGPDNNREGCNLCGGGVKSELPSAGLTDVFAGIVEGFTFKPTAHIHYDTHVLAIPDQLPKFADKPKEFGGSGELMDELP